MATVRVSYLLMDCARGAQERAAGERFFGGRALRVYLSYHSFERVSYCYEKKRGIQRRAAGGLCPIGMDFRREGWETADEGVGSEGEAALDELLHGPPSKRNRPPPKQLVDLDADLLRVVFSSLDLKSLTAVKATCTAFVNLSRATLTDKAWRSGPHAHDFGTLVPSHALYRTALDKWTFGSKMQLLPDGRFVTFKHHRHAPGSEPTFVVVSPGGNKMRELQLERRASPTEISDFAVSDHMLYCAGGGDGQWRWNPMMGPPLPGSAGHVSLFEIPETDEPMLLRAEQALDAPKQLALSSDKLFVLCDRRHHTNCVHVFTLDLTPIAQIGPGMAIPAQLPADPRLFTGRICEPHSIAADDDYVFVYDYVSKSSDRHLNFVEGFHVPLHKNDNCIHVWRVSTFDYIGCHGSLARFVGVASEPPMFFGAVNLACEHGRLYATVKAFPSRLEVLHPIPSLDRCLQIIDITFPSICRAARPPNAAARTWHLAQLWTWHATRRLHSRRRNRGRGRGKA